MRRVALIGLTLAAFCLFILQVYACSVDSSPRFEIKTAELSNCYFYSYNEDIPLGTDMQDFIKNKAEMRKGNCEGLTLNEAEQKTFREVINRLNKGLYLFGGINIVKQSEPEYLAFQKEAERKNSDACDCERIDNLSRYGEWTIYANLKDCPVTSYCALIRPKGCSIYQDIFGLDPLLNLILPPIFFIVLPVAIFALLFFAYKKIRKK
ncbi:MAG: hypothetical protein V1494_07410 [Candidatus Diapherotrites archaeon]